MDQNGDTTVISHLLKYEAERGNGGGERRMPLICCEVEWPSLNKRQNG